MNFISGGSPLGSSIVSSAANKIVGFQRGSADVAPRPPDLGSIIKTLSSNILTNVENRVQSINQNVNNVVNQSLKTFGQDYQDRIKQVDDAKPSGILANFLKLYQQAIGFIQFLGNRKNVKTLGDNLQVLQRIFTETFEVAKIIRQTIIKIVKQLSNLPTASTGGGGLNLDIKVPGGPLKRSAPKGMMNMLKMAGTGAAIAGGGALAVNALSGGFGGGEVQASPGSGSEGLSGPILDRFNVILDRFSAAIDSLSKKKSTPTPPPASSGGGGVDTQEKKDPPSSPGAPGAAPGGQTPGVTSTGERGVLDLIASVEQGPEGYDSFNTSRGKTNAKATEQTIGWLAANAKGAMGKYQQMPQFILERAERAGFNKNTKFTPEVQDAITLSELRKSHSMNEFLSGKISNEQFLQKLAPTWRGLPQGSINAAKLGGTADMTYQDQYAGGNRASKKLPNSRALQELQRIRTGSTSIAPSTTTPPPKPGVSPASTPAATQQQLAQTVAQPPPQQQKSQVTVAPMNMSTPQPQAPTSSGGGQPAQMSSGRQSPPMGASNDDNFFILYSKMVYSIVDG
jgi:muramidase (phage lysozyme)